MLLALRKTQNFADRFKQPAPLGFLLTQTFLPGSRETVDPRSPLVLGDPPFGGDPSRLLHAMKRRVQRSLLDAQGVVRYLLNPRGDAVSMLRLTAQRLVEAMSRSRTDWNFGCSAIFSEGDYSSSSRVVASDLATG